MKDLGSATPAFSFPENSGRPFCLLGDLPVLPAQPEKLVSAPFIFYRYFVACNGIFIAVFEKVGLLETIHNSRLLPCPVDSIRC